MGQKTSYPIIRCGIWYSTRANLMGTRGLPRLAVDGAPDGMGMGMVMGLHSCVWGVVRSGQVSTRCICMFGKRRSMDHRRNWRLPNNCHDRSKEKICVTANHNNWQITSSLLQGNHLNHLSCDEVKDFATVFQSLTTGNRFQNKYLVWKHKNCTRIVMNNIFTTSYICIIL